MKKMLFLISFLFSVVCFAAPPPDLLPDIKPSGQVEFVVQDNFNAPVYCFEAQEVAFVYLGNFELASYQEYAFDPVAKLEFPDLVIDDNYFAFAQELNKPPSNLILNGLTINKQHCNYGYPFTGN